MLVALSACQAVTPNLTGTPPDPPAPTGTSVRTAPPLLNGTQPPAQDECAGNCFYFDSLAGSDANPGTAPDVPWQSLDMLHAQTFPPGSVIHFRRGSRFDGGLMIDDPGTEDAPIRFTAYGEGQPPIFENRGTDFGRAISIHANWIVVENFLVREAMEAGIYVAEGAYYNVIRNNEITAVGEGLKIHGSYNLITGNAIHDLRMVVNTPGGDDDYGAVGIWLFAGDNEVAYNRIVNCKAESFDYGADGGAVEVWANPGVAADNNYIHHNYAQGNKGFSEFGGRGGSSRNTVIAYNVMVDNDRPLSIHMGGTFAIEVEGLLFENNTVVDTREADTFTAFTFTNGAPTPQTLNIRNNIFWFGNYQKFTLQATNGFAHSHNLYYFKNPKTLLNIELGEGERMGNPFFVNLTAFDLRLASGSPAVDAGLDLGYAADFDGNPVPQGSAPDLGAYEFVKSQITWSADFSLKFHRLKRTKVRTPEQNRNLLELSEIYDPVFDRIFAPAAPAVI